VAPTELTTPVTTSDTTRARGRYSTAAFLYTSAVGWTYQYVPALEGLTVSFSKDVRTSPPGSARFVVNFAATAGFPGRVVGATPGRTAPIARPRVWVFWPIIDADQYFLSGSSLDDGTDGSPGCAVSSYLVYGEPYLGASLPSFEGLLCGELYPDGGYAISTVGSVEDAESRVDSLLADLSGTQPSVVVDWGSYCFAVYSPDGKLTLSAENPDCRTARSRP
jgi:hypothetical protein